MRKQEGLILSFTWFSYFNFLIEVEKNYLGFKLPSLCGTGYSVIISWAAVHQIHLLQL